MFIQNILFFCLCEERGTSDAAIQEICKVFWIASSFTMFISRNDMVGEAYFLEICEAICPKA